VLKKERRVKNEERRAKRGEEPKCFQAFSSSLVPASEKYSSSSSPNAGGARVEYDTDDPSEEERGDTTDEATTDDGNDDRRFFKHSLSFLKNDSAYHDGSIVCQQT
jgi:hypothetical protein